MSDQDEDQLLDELRKEVKSYNDDDTGVGGIIPWDPDDYGKMLKVIDKQRELLVKLFPHDDSRGSGGSIGNIKSDLLALKSIERLLMQCNGNLNYDVSGLKE